MTHYRMILSALWLASGLLTGNALYAAEKTPVLWYKGTHVADAVRLRQGANEDTAVRTGVLLPC